MQERNEKICDASEPPIVIPVVVVAVDVHVTLVIPLVESGHYVQNAVNVTTPRSPLRSRS